MNGKVFVIIGWFSMFSSLGGLIAILPSINPQLRYFPYFIIGGIFILTCLAGWTEGYFIDSLRINKKTYRFWLLFVFSSIVSGWGYQWLIQLLK